MNRRMSRRAFLRQALVPVVAVPVVGSCLDATFRVGIGSCCDQAREMPIWRIIRNKRFDRFICLGDNVYADTRFAAVRRRAYETLAANLDYALFREEMGDNVLFTWDDHCYGVNDAGFDFPAKEDSKETLLWFARERTDSARYSREGIYDAYTIGSYPRNIQIILLDTRWFRSRPLIGANGGYVPNFSPTATLLGEEQWAWLERELKKPARVRILCTSIQCVSSVHGYEKWANFPLERSRLLQLLEKCGIKILFLASGDIHFAEYSKLITDDDIALHELTASGLNRFEPIARSTKNPHRVAAYDGGPNFGAFTVCWWTTPVTVRLEVFDMFGQKVIRHDVALC